MSPYTCALALSLTSPTAEWRDNPQLWRLKAPDPCLQVRLDVLLGSGRYRSVVVLVTIINVSKRSVRTTDYLWLGNGISFSFKKERDGYDPFFAKWRWVPRFKPEWFFTLDPGEEFTLCFGWELLFMEIPYRLKGSSATITGWLTATYDLTGATTPGSHPVAAYAGPVQSNSVKVTMSRHKVQLAK